MAMELFNERQLQRMLKKDLVELVITYQLKEEAKAKEEEKEEKDQEDKGGDDQGDKGDSTGEGEEQDEEEDSDTDDGDEMSVFVVMPDGSTITVFCRPTYTIHYLKGLIRSQKRIPQRHQKLVFRAVTLEDKMDLKDYFIGDFDTLHCLMDIEGGGKRARVSAAADQDEMLFFDPTPKADDVQVVKDALNVKSVIIGNWLRSLSLENVTKLYDLVDYNITNKLHSLTQITRDYVPFINEFIALEALPTVPRQTGNSRVTTPKVTTVTPELPQR